MNNIKKYIKSPLIVLIIAALVGGFLGSYLNYYFNNLSTENRNKELTKQLMLSIHNEIHQNYIHITQWGGHEDKSLLDVEGLELINLRAGNLTIKDKQLSFLIKMYVHFKVLNYKRNQWHVNWGDASGRPLNDYKKWQSICLREMEEYEKEFFKEKSLKSEIEAEWY